MWHIGIDLHRRTVVMAIVHDSGEVGEPTTFGCRETDRIVEFVRRFKPFRAVIEATSTYRWLYDLLTPEGVVLLAHPAKLRLMIERRAKTDNLDCQLLATRISDDSSGTTIALAQEKNPAETPGIELAYRALPLCRGAAKYNVG